LKQESSLKRLVKIEETPKESPFRLTDLNTGRKPALYTPPLFKDGTTKLQQQVQKKLQTMKENMQNQGHPLTGISKPTQPLISPARDIKPSS